jgi:acyl transferase domain-containing protein/NADPH:quinone reductase-like Zn-dependent oxidoreductase/NAD(P)-dependent dehydrogenase (short-subunit alcohol dehydrogenase family)/acyl carrier protein
LKNFPIAIIGIGCRFPGGASSPQAFWNLLKNGVDAIVDIPGDRWDIRRFYDPETEKPGKMHNRQGGFLEEKISEFDPLFFGISPREAKSLDPQQRLLLEVTYEAIEDAGLQLERLKGSLTGVFIGGFDLDNKMFYVGALNRQLIDAQTAANVTMTMLSNRLSYTFDLKGPSISIDTACSSSLVAIHTACQTLWNGDIDMAIAGGVNVMFLPDFTIVLSKGHFTSKHSRCKAFDADATGYVRGEGGGVVILKPYKQALADLDNIYAVIKGTAVNQDGQTKGITVPNPDAQIQLMRKVYQQAGIDVNQLHYIEAHGTGTPVGDRIEMEVLNKVLSENRKPGNQCLTGSVKTNIGHLEAAAGIAGLIKAALVLYHKQVPPHLHFKNPNPNLDFQNMQVKVVTQLQDLPQNEISYAGVNSFGYGGTNAHVLLQQTPKPAKPTVKPSPAYKNDKINTAILFPVSARDNQALKDLARKYYDFIVHQKPAWNDLIYSACFRRSHHKNRLVIAAETPQQLLECLQSYTKGVLLKGAIENQANIDQKPRIVFVYTGMGPQWWGMGRELMEKQPLFSQQIEKIDKIFSKHSGWSILNEMLEDEEHSRMAETQIAQPANFVIQVALTELLKSYGIEPDAVVGHSVGEVTAAFISGALSLEDALQVSYHRSRLQQKTAGQGKMLAVGMSQSQTLELIKFFEDVSVASINSPKSVTLSGNEDTLKQAASLMEIKGIFNRMLQVEVPYHSCLMDPLQDEMLESLKDIKPRKNAIKLYSTVTGKQLGGSQWGADYWWGNVRQPVNFAGAMETLINDGYSIFIEVGPHPVLKNSITECLNAAGKQGQLVQTLNRKEPEILQLYQGLAALFTLGFEINWQRISPEGKFIKLPAYPWQKDHYWHESELSRQDRLGKAGNVFLNNKVHSPHPAWDVELNPLFFPFINDHKVQDIVVFPGAAYTAAALALSQKVLDRDQAITLEDIEFTQILPIYNDVVQMLRTTVDPQKNTFSIHSWFKEDDPGWVLHTTGRMLKEPIGHKTPSINIDEIKARCTTVIPPEQIYRELASIKLEYGPYFKTIKEFRKGNEQSIIKIAGHKALADNTDEYLIHPTVLDGSFQAMVIFLKKQLIPVYMRRFTCYHSPGNQCWCFIQIKQITDNALRGDIKFCDENGSVAVEIEDLICLEIISRDIQLRDKMKEWFYDFQWQEAEPVYPPAEAEAAPSGYMLLFANENEYSSKLCNWLAAAKAQCTLITPGNQYIKLAGNHYQIRKDHSEDMQRLVTDTAGLKFSEILYSWGMGMDILKDIGVSHTVSQCMPVIYLAQALAKVRPGEEVKITMITRDAQVVIPGDLGEAGLTSAPLWGLGHLLRNEFPFITPKTIDLQSKEDWQSNSPQEEIQILVNELLSGNTEEDVALRRDQRWVKRLEKVTLISKEENKKYKMISTDAPVELATPPGGKIESLYYREFDHKKPGVEEITVKVLAAAINDKGLQKVLGKIPVKDMPDTYPGSIPGMEVSGIITAIGDKVTSYKVGDEIVIASPFVSFKSYITVKPRQIIHIHKPKTLSFAEAVILVPFLTVQYGLGVFARLQKGEKILIHNAADDVGLAAVQYAKWKGAEIYATANTLEKREYLKSIGIEQVMDMETLEFVKTINEITNGYGVDVVIHSIPGEALYQHLSLLAPYGRFIQVGKKNMAENHHLPLQLLNRNIAFTAVDFDCMMPDRLDPGRKELIPDLLEDLCRGFAQGYFQALPIEIFPAAKAVEAFKRFEQEKYIGKIVLDFHHQEVEVEAASETVIKKDATYIITGGTRGFGLEIARWLSAEGAGHIALISRSGAQSPEAQNAIKQMKQQGTRVNAYAVDITREDDVKKLIEGISQTMPPLTGIFHLALVLDDAFIMDVNEERMARVMGAKVGGVMNLHKYTKHLPLDHFICMSSISSLIGNTGQAAYVAANAFLDAFAHYRAVHGLVATTINLGVLAETGVVSRNSDVASILASTGIRAFTTEEALQALHFIMRQKPVQIGLFDVDWELYAQTLPKSAASSRFKTLTKTREEVNRISPKQLEIMNRLTDKPAKEKQDLVEQILSEELGKILGLTPERIDLHRGINFLGVDSIMVLEFVRAIYKRIEFEFSPMELLRGPTISQLAISLLKKIDQLMDN